LRYVEKIVDSFFRTRCICQWAAYGWRFGWNLQLSVSAKSSTRNFPFLYGTMESHLTQCVTGSHKLPAKRRQTTESQTDRPRYAKNVSEEAESLALQQRFRRLKVIRHTTINEHTKAKLITSRVDPPPLRQLFH